VKEAVVEEGEAQGIKVDEETATMIANVTIAQMEARGAFGAPAEEASVSPMAPGAEGEPPVVPAEGEPPPPPAAGEVQEEAFEPPAKKTLAERFQGK
jgi:hypothetical protein